MSRLSIEGSVCFHSVQFVFRSHIFRQVAIATGILWLSYQPKLKLNRKQLFVYRMSPVLGKHLILNTLKTMIKWQHTLQQSLYTSIG